MTEVGDAVVYVDEDGGRHNALVLALLPERMINLVYVATDWGDELGGARLHATRVRHASDRCPPPSWLEMGGEL